MKKQMKQNYGKKTLKEKPINKAAKCRQLEQTKILVESSEE